MSTTPTPTEIAEEASTWLVGGGVITIALFPLAVPIVALTAIAALPFLIPVIAVAAVVFPILLVRRVGRRAIRALRRNARPSERLPRRSSPPAGQGMAVSRAAR